MIIYFDESYDNVHRYLLYGALFVPRDSRLHQRYAELRSETGYQGEMKYTKCRNPRALDVARKLVDKFMEDSAYFRCAVVEQERFDYSRFGRPDETESIKKARAYKKFAEMLLNPYVASVRDAVFLADELKRCPGDEFLERLRERFNPPHEQPTFRHMEEVSSSRQEYQCLQICDLLLGCVLNNLVPPKNQYKIDIRKHVCERIGVRSFLPTNWKMDLAEVLRTNPKIHVWYWRPKKKPRHSAGITGRRT